MAAVGRPTAYKKSMLKDIEHYIDHYNEAPYNDKMPMVVSLALVLGVHKDTIYEWLKHDDKKDFSDLVGDVMQKQEKVLFNGALDNTFNASITKLALTKHGYSDKQEIAGKDGEHLIPDAISISFVKPK